MNKMKEDNTINVSLIYDGLGILIPKNLEGIKKGESVVISFSYPDINISLEELNILKKFISGFRNFIYTRNFFILNTLNTLHISRITSLGVFYKELGISQSEIKYVKSLMSKKIITEFSYDFVIGGVIRLGLKHDCNLQINQKRKVLFEKFVKYKQFPRTVLP